ncbi:MAG: UDP-2,3-diacylglucosamine diphosphatase [Desulfuromonadales bacterium]
MRALFLADAHLCKPEDPNYRVLLTFLEEQCGRTDLLVLLGDIFEFWVGKETPLAVYVPLIDALERMGRQGTRLVCVEGNHDFHLGPVFTERLQARVLPDGGSIELDGRSVYLAHGDLADPADHGYRRLRRVLRSPLMRGLIRSLPNRLLIAIATRASNASRKQSTEQRRTGPVREILWTYAQAILAAGHAAVITGHFHCPFHEKQDDGELIALGDWITQFSYAVYENGHFTLNRYHPPASAGGAHS